MLSLQFWEVHYRWNATRFPLRIVIGGKGLKEGQVEVKWRDAAGPVKVPIVDAVSTVREMLADRRRQEAAAVPA